MGDSKVGYLLFNDHIATAEAQLIDAFEGFKSEGVTELVLDMRYNGGGYLDIARMLASMIAGEEAVDQTFSELKFNSKYPTQNPITGRTLSPSRFARTAPGFVVSSETDLPLLNLNRVVVISGSGTCSASEAVINGLRGIGVEVILIGDTTCGKPYGFYGIDNCGTTYFTIQFKGVNASGFGDYTDGFSPPGAENVGVEVGGCAVDDDLSQALGNPDEARLATALEYLSSGSCQASAAGVNAKRRRETLMNRVALTLASFLAYFALSGMLAPIGILVQPSAAALGVSAGEMVRTLGFFSTGTLAGSLAAVVLLPSVKLRTLTLSVLRRGLLCLAVSFADADRFASNCRNAVRPWRLSWHWFGASRAGDLADL